METRESSFFLTHIFHIIIEDRSFDKDDRLSFNHQYFRDFLAALHIANVIEDALYNESFNLPIEVSKQIWSVYVRNMLGDFYSDYKHSEAFENHRHKQTDLHKLLDKLRGFPANETGYTINNIIETWRITRGDKIIGEDLTNLDLSQVPIIGVLFYNDTTSSKFDGSIISKITILPQGHSGSVLSAQYSSDGRRILSASSDGTIKEWDIGIRQCLRTISVKQMENNLSLEVPYIYSAQYSLDGQRILSASVDGTIKEWEEGKCRRTLKGHSGGIRSVQYNPKIPRLALSASVDGTIKEWDIENEKCLRTLEGHSGRVIIAQYNSEGLWALSASADGTIKEWDIEKEKCRLTLYRTFWSCIECTIQSENSTTCTVSIMGWNHKGMGSTKRRKVPTNIKRAFWSCIKCEI